jgi:predicted phage terminase large subunit-like protein
MPLKGLNENNYSEVEVAVNLARAAAINLARRNFIDFVEYIIPSYQTVWYHRKIASELDRLYNGDIKKLMIFAPPQHGKTLLATKLFPAYVLGKNPKLSVAGCAYSIDLASKFNREIQRYIDSKRYQDVFPDTKLNSSNVVADSKGSWLRNSEIFEVVKYGGSYKGVGIGGPLTGNKVDIGCIDDPIKDRAEAQSETYRERHWEWYMDVFCTRLHNDSKRLLILTRWHEDDLAGRILQKETGWTVLKFPALREDYSDNDDPRLIGQPLWPERHELSKIEEIRSLSPRTFASMYQQRPAPTEGGMFKKEWLRYWTAIPQNISKLILTMDCAFKGTSDSDYVVAAVFAKSGIDTYMIDMVRGQWDFPETIRQLKLFIAKYPHLREKYIEDKANGQAVIDTLKNQIVGIIPVTPKESKESRASAVSNIISSGHFYLPMNANWRDIAINELTVFPNGAHDDIVDVVCHALMKLYPINNTYGAMLKI